MHIKPYERAYKNYKETPKLYYIIDPKTLSLRERIIQEWKTQVVFDAYQIHAPLLVPTEILNLSGHKKNFSAELMEIKDTGYTLRPQTAQSIFGNLKSLRMQLKGEPLGIWQVGKAFRIQRSTRDGVCRKNEFEQMELQMLTNKPIDFFQKYLPILKKYFETIGLSPQDLCFKQLGPQDRPHYSHRTIDIMYTLRGRELEIGCINDRSNHDLHDFSELERTRSKVYQISLGLDRIITILSEITILKDPL